MRAETTLIMEYCNQHSIQLCYCSQRTYFHYVISAKIKSETNAFNHRFVHCFVNFRAKIHMNHMIKDCTTKESFELGGIFYTTILFALKWMVNVNGTIQDRIANENFNKQTPIQLFCLLRITNLCWRQSRKSCQRWIVQTKASSAISVISV